MFTIRQYADVDRDDVVELWNECGLVVPWNDPQVDIEKKIKFQPNLFFIGELDGTLIATCMAGYEGHRGWINYLAVSPQLQRKRFGRSGISRISRPAGLLRFEIVWYSAGPNLPPSPNNAFTPVWLKSVCMSLEEHKAKGSAQSYCKI